MKLKNLTPHDIIIVGENKNIVISPSGVIARLSTNTSECGQVEFEGIKIPLTKTNFGKVENLPEETSNIKYIVSQLIKNCPECQNRTDLLVPAEVVRDEKGNIMGCKSLGF